MEELEVTVKRPKVNLATSNSSSGIRRLVTKHGLLLSLGGVFLLLFVAFSGRRSLWDDEGLTVDLGFASWHVFLMRIWGTEANGALFTTLIRVWIWLTGLIGIHATEPVVRFPSAVFGAITVVAVYLLARKFIHPVAAWASALLCGLSTSLLYYSQEARPYTIYFACVVIAYYCLFSILSMPAYRPANSVERRNIQRYWIAYAVSMGICIDSHLIGVTFVAAQVILYTLLLFLPTNWQRQARRQVRAMGISLAGILLLSFPILLDGALYGTPSLWLVAPTKLKLFEDVSQSALGYNQAITSILYTIAAVGVLGIGIRWVLLRRKAQAKALEYEPVAPAKNDMSGLSVGLISWFVLPPLIAFILSRPPFHQHLFLVRYQLGAYIAAFFLIGYIFLLIPGRLLKGMALVALLVMALVNLGAYATLNPEQGYSDLYAYVTFQQSMNWLEQQYQPGDGIVCVSGTSRCSDLVEYYLNYAWPQRTAHYQPDSPDGYTGDPLITAPAVTSTMLAAYATQHRRIFLVNDINPPDDMTAEYPLLKRYKLIAHNSTTTVGVWLYQVATSSAQTSQSGVYLLTAGENWSMPLLPRRVLYYANPR